MRIFNKSSLRGSLSVRENNEAIHAEFVKGKRIAFDLRIAKMDCFDFAVAKSRNDSAKTPSLQGESNVLRIVITRRTSKASATKQSTPNPSLRGSEATEAIQKT